MSPGCENKLRNIILDMRLTIIEFLNEGNIAAAIEAQNVINDFEIEIAKSTGTLVLGAGMTRIDIGMDDDAGERCLPMFTKMTPG